MALRALERVPIDRIQEQAKPVDIGRVLMMVVMAVVYALAFAAHKTGMTVGVLLGWVVAAAKTGWRDAALPAEERRRARAA